MSAENIGTCAQQTVNVGCYGSMWLICALICVYLYFQNFSTRIMQCCFYVSLEKNIAIYKKSCPHILCVECPFQRGCVATARARGQPPGVQSRTVFCEQYHKTEKAQDRTWGDTCVLPREGAASLPYTLKPWHCSLASFLCAPKACPCSTGCGGL